MIGSFGSTKLVFNCSDLMCLGQEDPVLGGDMKRWWTEVTLSGLLHSPWLCIRGGELIAMTRGRSKRSSMEL